MGSAVIVNCLFSVLEDKGVFKNKGGVAAALNRSVFYSIADKLILWAIFFLVHNQQYPA